MSYQRERDEFMVRCKLSPDTARALLRHATTLQRLAVAQCNGDWPADNGERKTVPCPLCESSWVPSQIQGGPTALRAHGGPCKTCSGKRLREYKHTSTTTCPECHGAEPKACPDCRTEARVHALLEGTQWQAWTQGDPRGYVLKLFPRSICESCKKPTCQKSLGMIPVTRDDMDCERVSALGVPTR